MLQVTPRAAEALKNYLQGEGKADHALRIVAQGGCCSGTTYGLSLEKEAMPDDVVIQQEGVKIYVNPMSGALLSEAKLDFENGPQGETFFIDNPMDQGAHNHEHGSCGCSEGGGSCGCGSGSCNCNH